MNGLDEKNWENWIALQNFLQIEKKSQKKLNEYRKRIEQFQEFVNITPLQRKEDAEWLPKSFLNIDGYWKLFPFDSIFPKNISNSTQINCMLYRKNGDLIVGTDKGILQLSLGYWQWFGFNEFRKEFAEDIDETKLSGSSTILSLTEIENGDLLIGTANGLIITGEKIKGKAKAFVRKFGSDVVKKVTSILDAGSEIFFIADNSLYSKTKNVFQKRAIKIDGNPVKFITAEDEYSIGYFLLTDKKVYFLDNENKFEELFNSPQENLFYSNENLYAYSNGKVVEIKEQNDGGLIELELYGTPVATDAGIFFGAGEIPINKNEKSLSVFSDLGISIYHNDFYSHFYLPLKKDKILRAKMFAGKGNNFTILTDEGLLRFNPENNITVSGKITDIVTIDELGASFIADGTVRFAMNYDDLNRVGRISDLSGVSNLAVDNQGRLIANSGLSIYRFKFDVNSSNYDLDEIFYCQQFEPQDDRRYKGGSVNDIFVDSENNIWVTTDFSLFRYYDIDDSNYVLEEYNYFRDPERFPSRTGYLWKTFETLDGKIRVVCSDESHLNYRGVSLEGGLLEWDPKNSSFVRLNDSQIKYPFFVNSYTKISGTSAIIGTNKDFYMENDGFGLRGTVFDSYKKIKEKYYSMFLSTEGTKLGEVWLFGAAAGVIGYYGGTWFYPQRINQVLPDGIEFENYGGRHVNAISSAENGKLYIGTDRGLLIYTENDPDGLQLLEENFKIDDAVKSLNISVLNKEKTAVLNGIGEQTELKGLVSEIAENDNEIIKLKNIKNSSYEDLYGNKRTDQNKDSLTAVIKDLEKRQTELLLKLQEDEPGMYQLLRMPPLDLLASRKKLEADECIVQYIGMANKMYIQILSKDNVGMKLVEIDHNLLADSIFSIASYLGNEENTRGGQAVSSVEIDSAEKRIVQKELSWLYDILIRPIKDDISGFENVLIVPSAELNYIPFSALCYEETQNKYRYAIEDHNIGYLSSMYLFNLVFDKKISQNQKILIMADPDGSLPGAKTEGEEIFKDDDDVEKFFGSDATTENLLDNIEELKYLHLATHGYLDEENINKSWLLFADKKMKMSEAYNLDLEGADMVVLSACETSYGKSGIEYATLARAFANAGVPSVVATLWQVNDEAAKRLMVDFYKNLALGKNKIEALAISQRKLIESNDQYFSEPSKWAPYIAIGKP